MRRTLAALLLLASLSAAAQQVDTGHLKLKTDGGAVGDSSNALTVAPYSGTTAPASPVLDQEWFDENTSPATHRRWNGSDWEVLVGSLVAFVDTLADLPATPGAGSCVMVRTTYDTLCYDAANSKWVNTRTHRFTAAGSDYFDTTYPAVMSPTASAPSASAGGGGTSFTNGSHTCKVTFYNSTGGDTGSTGSTASASFTTSSQSVSLSSIPLGPSGTVGRHIWCTKSTGGDWFYVDKVADNTTTTAVVGATDASLLIPIYKVNWSGAIGSGYSCYVPSGKFLGGCGSDGSHWVIGVTESGTLSHISSTTEVNVPRLRFDISAWAGNDYTAVVRIVDITADLSAARSLTGPIVSCLRNGSAQDAIFECMGQGANNVPSPTAAATLHIGILRRGTAAASTSAAPTNTHAITPAITSFPYLLRIQRRLSPSNPALSNHTYGCGTDGILWTSVNAGVASTGATTISGDQADAGTAQPSTEYNFFEWPAWAQTANTAGHLLRIDSFEITSN